MSRFEGPQGIVTNGLVLNLDAGDPDSYTRSQPPYVEVLVVAGGGGTGYDVGGGGGAGGVIYNSAYQITNAAAITVTIGAGGGSGQTLTTRGTNGNNSVFGSLTAIGGGGGGAYNSAATAPGLDGGSGGGGGNYQSAAGGNGTPGQGFNGGSSAAATWGSGAGGGAGGPGANGIANQTVAGGAYATYAISGQSANYAGGGYGAYDSQTDLPTGQDSNGTTLGTYGFGANGTGSPNNSPYSGNQGIVIVRYPGLPAATGGTITYLNGYTIHTFTSSGTFTPYQWYNNTNPVYSGSLINGPVFNPQIVGGYFQFDGTDDYVLFNAPIGSTNTVSVEMWSKIPSSYPSDMFFGWNAYDVWCDNGNIGYNTNNGDLYGISSASVAELGVVNNWVQYTFEMRSDVAYTNNKIYINGISQSLSQLQNSEAGGNRNFNSGAGVFPGYRASLASYLMAYQVGSFRVYNRSLSQTEISQNFNSQCNRYGLGLPSNGLIVNLDANSGQSYPGTGTTWYDLSGTGNNAILANGVSFSSAYGGIFDFDGVDDYAYIPDNATLDLAGDKSQGIWLYMDQSYSGTGMLGKADTLVNGMALSYGWSGGGFQNIAWNSANDPSITSNGADINNWYYVAGVQKGSTRYIYVVGANGVRVAGYNGGNHTWNNSLNFTIGTIAGYYTNMKAGAVHVYNRALSGSEIFSIYVTQKSRFGL